MLQKKFAISIRIMSQEQVELIKRELEQSLKRAMKTPHNSLKNLVQGLNHKLELSQNFFLGNNVDCGQQQLIIIIPKKTIRRCALRRSIER